MGPVAYPPANPYISSGPGIAGASRFPYGNGAAALAAAQAAAGGSPNPPPPDKAATLSAFRRAAIKSLSERLARSIEQSEHLISEETDKFLEQTRLVEENRKA